MNLFEPINHSQTLLQQLSIAINNNSESELKRILNALANDLEQIKINTSTLQQQLTQLRKNKTLAMMQTTMVIAKPEIKSGCYIFSGEKGFFCPRCYDNHSNKVATTRLNSKLRICPACRASLK